MKLHEGGIIQVWKNKWWPKAATCFNTPLTEAKAISLIDVQSAFYACIIGIFLGAVALIVEIMISKYRKYKEKKSMSCDT